MADYCGAPLEPEIGTGVYEASYSFSSSLARRAVLQWLWHLHGLALFGVFIVRRGAYDLVIPRAELSAEAVAFLRQKGPAAERPTKV